MLLTDKSDGLSSRNKKYILITWKMYAYMEE
jgi:hypothetical protein